MVCPFCLHKKTLVYNSRTTKKLNDTWRRRRCLRCKKQFTTHETADPASIFRVGTARKAIPFSHGKLLFSLARVCDHRHDTDEAALYLSETILQALYKLAALQDGHVTTADIAKNILASLKAYDVAAYVKYLSYHSDGLDKRSLKQFMKS